MCGVQFNDGKGAKDLMLMLALNETLSLLPMSSSVHWYGHVLRRALDLVHGRMNEGWYEHGRCSLMIKMDW